MPPSLSKITRRSFPARAAQTSLDRARRTRSSLAPGWAGLLRKQADKLVDLGLIGRRKLAKTLEELKRDDDVRCAGRWFRIARGTIIRARCRHGGVARGLVLQIGMRFFGIGDPPCLDSAPRHSQNMRVARRHDALLQLCFADRGAHFAKAKRGFSDPVSDNRRPERCSVPIRLTPILEHLVHKWMLPLTRIKIVKGRRLCVARNSE